MKVPALPLLIGLHGASGAGKSTVAAHLCGVHDFRSYSIAGPLRQALYALDPLLSSQESLRPLVDETGWEKALTHRIHGPEVTRLLHALRTEASGALLGPDAWVHRLEVLALADADLLGPAPIVVTDVNTPDEAQWLLDGGGAIWQVERPGHVPTGQLHDRYITAVITNDATVLALTRRVDRAMAGLPRTTEHAALA